MVEASFGWHDVGSWTSLERLMPGDELGNRHMAKTILFHMSSGNITQTRKEFTAVLGVNDLIVVEEEDVLIYQYKIRNR